MLKKIERLMMRLRGATKDDVLLLSIFDLCVAARKLGYDAEWVANQIKKSSSKLTIQQARSWSGGIFAKCHQMNRREVINTIIQNRREV